MKSKFYTFLRKHWKSFALLAVINLLVLVAISDDKLSMFTGLILFYTLISIIAYTDETHELVTLQHEQFSLMNRPWLYVDDISYDSHPTGLTVAILLVNSGKTPAIYDPCVERFAVTPLFGEKEIILNPIMRPAGATSIVFPFVEGKETRYMIPLHFSDSQSEYFQPQCKVEVKLRLAYKALTADDRKKPFGYEATLVVPSLNEKVAIQTTHVSGIVAT